MKGVRGYLVEAEWPSHSSKAHWYRYVGLSPGIYRVVYQQTGNLCLRASKPAVGDL
jgi:hypothetical protein